MAGVTIDGVSKRFGQVEVIHNVSIGVPDGAFAVLVGPSGCGKSTLLRLVAGLETVSSGRITIGDRVVNDVAPKDRDVAMVFQNYALYPHLNVAGNMGFSLKVRGERADSIDRKVREAAALLGLEPYLDRRPAQLSGGQRQRVAIGRSIVRAPRVFLFDEPLSNLDAQLRVQMRSEIRDLQQRLGTTTIYVTHDQVEAMTLATAIVVLRDGIVEQSGAPLEVYDRPANCFVARFMGSPSMNLVDAVVVETEGRLLARTESGALLDLPRTVPVRAGDQITCGFRPEYVRLSAAGAAVEVASVEHTGSETYMTLTLGADRLQSATRERHGAQRGDRLHMAVAVEHLHVFDQATGKRKGDL